MLTKQEMSEAYLYELISKVPMSLSVEKYDEYYPEVTEEALDSGILVRYFIRQANHTTGYITEIDKPTYEKFSRNSLYLVISVDWRIVGELDDKFGPRSINTPVRIYTGVKTSNELTLADAEKIMPGISRKLTNIVQFWAGR